LFQRFYRLTSHMRLRLQGHSNEAESTEPWLFLADVPRFLLELASSSFFETLV